MSTPPEVELDFLMSRCSVGPSIQWVSVFRSDYRVASSRNDRFPASCDVVKQR